MQNKRIVDSNVAIVANGRGTNASIFCQLKAIEALNRLLKKGIIVIDQAGEMIEEYRRYCYPRGQPGIGDRFFQEILTNYSSRIERVQIDKKDGEFLDFPNDPDLKHFDHSDRKFVAAARKSGASILNATDTDWINSREALAKHGVRVEFVCSEVTDAWFAAN